MLPLSAVAAITYCSCGNCVQLIIRSLSTKAAVTSVHAFVSNRLDYCNACDLYPVYGAVITSGQPYYVSTGYLYDSEYCSRSLSCLPVSKRPGTVVLGRLLSTHLRDVRPRRLFVLLCDRRTRTTYTATGVLPLLIHECGQWNSLPTELRQSDSLGQFKRL